MNEQNTNTETSKGEESEKNAAVKKSSINEFKLNAISSAEMIRKPTAIDEERKDALSVNAESPRLLANDKFAEEKEEIITDPIFAELAAPKLPALPKEDRARLQMQSPTRLYFYWSFKRNPFQVLKRALGKNTGNYALIVKLVNRKNESEEIYPIEAEGAWWFNVDADSVYRAEIGFYAPTRPFICLMRSNTVETPRKTPSPRRSQSDDWTISANQFAEVLNVSGFARDAFEAALAGDDYERSENATRNAFSQLLGGQENFYSSDEIRFSLLALASGYILENLRGQIGASLFAVLQSNKEKLSAENALASLQENFDVFSAEIELAPTVFGASLINFPRAAKRERFLPKLAPISSFRF